MTPCARTDSARPPIPSASMCFRGCRAFARMEPSGICSSSDEEAPPPMRTSRPRPNPLLLGAVDKLARNSVISVGSGGGRVVRGDRQAVARRLGEPDAPRDDGIEDELAEMAPHLGSDVGRQPRAPVHHRQEHPRDCKVRIEARAYEL